VAEALLLEAAEALAGRRLSVLLNTALPGRLLLVVLGCRSLQSDLVLSRAEKSPLPEGEFELQVVDLLSVRDLGFPLGPTDSGLLLALGTASTSTDDSRDEAGDTSSRFGLRLVAAEASENAVGARNTVRWQTQSWPQHLHEPW